MIKWREHYIAFEQTAQITSHQSFLGMLNVPLASQLIIKRDFSCSPTLIGQNVHVHFGHIHVSLPCAHAEGGKVTGHVVVVVVVISRKITISRGLGI